MSMFSITSASLTSRRATVRSNGYRFAQTRSIVSIPSRSSVSAWSGSSRTASSAGVQARVERLDPAAEDLGGAGQVLDHAHLDAPIAQRRGGAAGGDDLDPEPLQSLRELDQPALVGDRDQRPPHPQRLGLALERRVGRNRCRGSPAHPPVILTRRGFLIVDPDRSRGDQLDGAGEQPVLDRMDPLEHLLHGASVCELDRLLHEDRAGVDALVDEVHRDPGDPHPVGERLPDRVEPRERRQEGGVDVDDPVSEAADELVGEQQHVAGEDDAAGPPADSSHPAIAASRASRSG